MTLNLDSNFKPVTGSEIKYEAFTFSGGEPHIRIEEFDISEPVIITHRVRTFNDLGLLSIAVDALRRLGAKEIELVLPYFPGARQDRVMTAGESLSVKVYADIINGYGLKSITIYDPHSDVTPALLNNCKAIDNHSFVAQLVQTLPENILLISPDAGASKKIQKLARFLQLPEVLECGKKREVKTGKLSGFTVPRDDLGQRPCLIVDDICDGGGTFIGLGKELKSKNSGPLFLAISHGIFSKGFDELLGIYDKIFTTDSFKDVDGGEFVIQKNLADGLLSS